MNQKLKIALIVDSTISSKYVYDLVRWAKDQTTLEVSSLIVQPGPVVMPNRIADLIESRGFSFIEKLELLLLKKTKRHQDHLDKFDLSDYVYDVIDLDANDLELQKIKEKSIDVLVDCGSGVPHCELSSAAKCGIISLRHADHEKNHGGPCGFWEVFNKHDATGFVIQHSTEQSNSNAILFQGFVTTQHYYLLNQAHLYTKSNYYLKKILLDLSINKCLPEKLESFPYFNQPNKRPTSGVQLRYLFNLAKAKLVHLFSPRKSERWGVAFQFSNWRDLVMWKSTRIANPPNHFLADPFVVQHENKHYCFVEDYDDKLAKGHISLYQITEANAIRQGEIIVEPFHMSYPYVFKYQSNYYLVPETSANKDIRLYQAEEFPHKWKLLKTIFTDISAVDTTIFEKDNLWWLFTNIDLVNSGDHCSELFLFYADDPISGTWIPHPKNPVVCNSLKARNGGIVFDGSSIYRVSQKQGIARYGMASNINKIIHLSKTNYQEELQLTIEPNFFNDLKGTHHMHSNGEVTVFDFIESKPQTN